MLFSLKLQRDNRQNALAVDPPKGKTGEKVSSHCGDETTINYNRAKEKRLSKEQRNVGITTPSLHKPEPAMMPNTEVPAWSDSLHTAGTPAAQPPASQKP